MFLRKSIQVLLLAASLAVSAAHAITYSLDDGTREGGIGIPPIMTFGNQFTVVPGGETITSISIAWGETVNGTPMLAKLWSDPNGDGDPSDAVVLSSIAGTVANAGTNIFNVYDITDVTLALAQSFFVGASIAAAGGGPAGFDGNTPTTQSWLDDAADFGVGSSPDQFPLAWTVRANAVAVAEPGSLALLAVGLIAFGITRRRKTA